MKVHTGSRRNGKTTKMLQDAAFLSQRKPVLCASPNTQMAKFVMRAFIHLMGENKLRYRESLSAMSVTREGCAPVYFIGWETLNDPNYLKGKDVYVVIDELGLILKNLFSSTEARIMSVNIEQRGEEL